MPNPINWFLFILVLLLCGLLLMLLTAALMARALLHPPRMTDARAVWLLKRLSPGDLGLSFAPMSFRVRDEDSQKLLNLAAWWIPSQNTTGRCAILIHGYADAKVGAIAWAPLLHSLGYNILALDLPGHGESDYRPISFGFWERHLVSQVIDQLRIELPDAARSLALYGLSYGAIVAAATAGIRDDITAVVLDSPPPSPHRAESVHYHLLGMPGRPVSTLAIYFAARLSHANWRKIHIADLIQHLRAPLLLIESGRDPFNSPDDLRRIDQAIDGRRKTGRRTDYLFLSHSAHLMGIQTAPEYAQAIRDFLTR